MGSLGWSYLFSGGRDDGGGDVGKTMPSLAGLSIGAPVGARKRSGHHGLRINASASVALVVLSRLLRSKDVGVLEARAASAMGSALLGHLRATALVLASVGASSSSLTPAVIAQLFRLEGAVVASASQYATTSIAAALPHAAATVVYHALLDALTEVSSTQMGTAIAVRLNASSHLLNLEDSAAVTALVQWLARWVEEREAEPSPPPPPAVQLEQEHPPPAAPLPPPSEPSTAASSVRTPTPAPTTSSLDAAASLATNAALLLQARLERALEANEREELTRALDEALMIIYAGDGEARRTALHGGFLESITTIHGAQLWAAVAESLGSPAVGSVHAAIQRLMSACEVAAGNAIVATVTGFND